MPPNYAETQRQRLNAGIRVLTELQGILRGIREHGNVHHWATISGPALELQKEVQELQQLFPELKLPEYHPGAGTGSEAYIARALPLLEVAVEQAEALPIEKLAFPFVRDEGLRRIIERDFQEIERAFLVKCWKSVIVLSGGAIEAILLDLLLQGADEAMASKGAPAKKDLRAWDLSELIAVAVELKLIDPIAATLQNAVRLYRNLIHPGYELRTRLTPEQLEAQSGLNVLQAIHRDLSRRSPS